MKSKTLIPELFSAGRIELHTTSKGIRKSLSKLGIQTDKDYLKDCAGACIHEHLQSTGVLLVYVSDRQLPTLIHELFHATVRYLAYVGVPVQTNESNETYAYFLEHLTREFLPVIRP